MQRFESLDAIDTDDGMYVLCSDAQSRIAELEAAVARLRDTSWNDAIDAAASLQINGMDVISPVAKAYILGILRR